MKDTFSTYHPLLNMLYFVGVIGVTVFVVHPVILAISLFGGIAYSVLLKGWKKTVKFNLIFSIPMMLIVALMNPMFNHYGVTIIGYLHNGNPFTLESCVYGLVMENQIIVHTSIIAICSERSYRHCPWCFRCVCVLSRNLSERQV